MCERVVLDIADFPAMIARSEARQKIPSDVRDLTDCLFDPYSSPSAMLLGVKLLASFGLSGDPSMTLLICEYTARSFARCRLLDLHICHGKRMVQGTRFKYTEKEKEKKRYRSCKEGCKVHAMHPLAWAYRPFLPLPSTLYLVPCIFL
jgi:hypothetical protein